MKKKMVVGLAVIFLLLTQSALAEEYTVKPRDCLSMIGKQLAVSWRKIAKVNKIRPPNYVIRVGQKLKIPSSVSAAVSKPAAADVASAPASSEYLEKIKALEAKIAELSKRLLAATDVEVIKEAPAQVSVGRNNSETGNENLTEVRGTVAAVGTAISEKSNTQDSLTPMALAKNVVRPLNDSTLQAFEPVHGPIAANDKFEPYILGGASTSIGRKDTATNGFGQLDIAYRPFTTKLFDREVGIGGGVIGEIGSGAVGQYDYRYGKMIPNFNIKFYGDRWRWDATTKLGWARQWDFGVSDKQTTDSAYLMEFISLNQRRADGYKWLPQTELMFIALMPFSASRESTKDGKTFGQSLPTNDKSVYSFDFRQSLYDFYPSKNLRVTPGIALGTGLEAGDLYGKIGPFMKIASYGQDIVRFDLSLKNKSSVDGNQLSGLVMLKPYGIYKAWKAAHITKPTADDLVYKPVQ